MNVMDLACQVNCHVLLFIQTRTFCSVSIKSELCNKTERNEIKWKKSQKRGNA